MFLGGLVVSIVVGLALMALTGWTPGELTDDQTTIFGGVSGIAQFSAFGGLLWLLLRYKGGGLAHDLGVFRDREIGPLIGCFIAGIGLEIALGLALLPLRSFGDQDNQEVVEQIASSSGPALALLAVMAVLLAPVFEELLFRGVLLRALLRRMPPTGAVLVSSTMFGVVHLLDPKAFPIQPALIGLGMVSAILAIYGGGMLRSIALHMGFNFVTVFFALLS